MQISYHLIITEKCEKKRFLRKFHKCRPAQVSLLPAFGREMPQNRWKYPDGSVTIKLYECALSVTCGDRSPLLSLRDIFPRSGGSPSSKGEPLAIHASFISLPKPLPLGEVDLRSKDGEGEHVCTSAIFTKNRTIYRPKRPILPELHSARCFALHPIPGCGILMLVI